MKIDIKYNGAARTIRSGRNPREKMTDAHRRVSLFYFGEAVTKYIPRDTGRLAQVTRYLIIKLRTVYKSDPMNKSGERYAANAWKNAKLPYKRRWWIQVFKVKRNFQRAMDIYVSTLFGGGK